MLNGAVGTFSLQILIFDTLCKGVILLLLGHSVDWVLRQTSSPASIRRAGWALVMAVLLVLPFGGAVLPNISLSFQAQEAPSPSPSTLEIRQSKVPTKLSGRPSGLNDSLMANTTASAFPATPTPSTADEATSASQKEVPWTLLLVVGFWATGAMLLLVRAGIGVYRGFQLRSRGEEASSSWKRKAARVAEEMGISQSVGVRVSKDVSVPVVIGFWKPTILLPTSASEWPEERRTVVLWHELVHHLRWDLIVGILALGARALHWPNPLVWTGRMALRDAQEEACDTAVLRSGIDAKTYTLHLVRLARSAMCDDRAAGYAAAGGLHMARSCRLERRVDAILQRNRPLPSWGWKLKTFAGIAVVGLSVAVMAFRPVPWNASELGPATPGAVGASSTSPSGVRVAGRLTGPGGEPLTGASVHIEGPGPLRTVRAQGQGTFQISLPRQGRYYLWVDEPQYRGVGTFVTTSNEEGIVRWTPELIPRRTRTDSAFGVQIRRAWDQIAQNGGIANTDSLQRAYGSRFYQYYRAHPDTYTGLRAASSSFRMWNNLGDISSTKSALRRAGPQSRLWAQGLLHGLSAYCYKASETKDSRDYFRLLQRLEGKLTHPRARAAVLVSLGDLHSFRGDTTLVSEDEALEFYLEATRMNVDSVMTAKAQRNIHEITALNPGSAAPDFEAETMSGGTISLSDLRGKTVLLWFWSPLGWPEKSLPHLKALRQKYYGKGLRIVGVAHGDNSSKIRDFIEKHDLKWPQIRTELSTIDEMPASSLGQLYNARTSPTTYLIGPGGHIKAERFFGEEIRKVVNKHFDRRR